MFCTKCGNQIPDNTKFCTFCGAPQNAEPAAPATPVAPAEPTAPAPQFQQPAPQFQQPEPQFQQPAPQYQQPAPQYQPVPQYQQPAPKKKSGAGKVVAIVIICVLVLSVVISGIVSGVNNAVEKSGMGTSKDSEINSDIFGSDDSDDVPSNNTPPTTTVNPAYDAVFEGTGIVHFQTFFGMDTASFARKEANGMISCSDYGYKDDVVYKIVETVYCPVSQYTEEQKTILQNSMKTQFATYENLNCCTVEMKMGTNYLTLTCTYTDVNTKEACDELYNAGIMKIKADRVSMQMTESGLLAKGSVKK